MRRRWYALVLTGALLIVGAITGLAATPSAQAGTEQTFAKHVQRVFYNADGTTTPADPDHPGGYDVKLSVSTTQNLRGDQPITVSWTGAHPTGGVVQNPAYGAQGSQMEYPFILMECRGTAATVSPDTCWTQTSVERTQRSNVSDNPAWRADGAAPSADRAAHVNLPPGTRDSSCRLQANEHWTPITAVNGTTYYGTCFDGAPEQSEIASTGVPDNTTYGVTGSSGKGSAQFAVWSSDDNATLGCSSTVACSLVAIPVTGIDCDPYFTQTSDKSGASLGIDPGDYEYYKSECEQPDVYQAGEASDNNGNHFNVATSGRLWWSASNWDNRIVVPLSFAVSGSICSVVNGTAPLLAYGSILMTDIAAQWQPKFCTTAGFQPFLHVQATDTQARTLVDAGSARVGFSTRPPDEPFSSAIAQAPVAVSGFAIAYNIDGADGEPYDTLRLNARLLAKLLTESYAGGAGVENSAIAGNPATILTDPEFHALNPDLPSNLLRVLNSAATMISLSSDSDMLEALSSYIQADPDAHKWLDGVPDPWGMKVNPAYELDVPAGQNASDAHLTLPVTSWPLLDQFELPDSDGAVCLSGKPYMAQVAHPLSQISQIEQDIEFGISNSQTVCPAISDPTDPTNFVPKIEGLQTPGHRFVIGVVPLTAVDRYGLRAAALETSSNIGPQTKFTTDAGKSFASPDDAGLKAAVKLLSPDANAGAWTFDYSEISSQTDAYPGLMPIYADVPTSGLSPDDAARVAQFLDFAAGDGQTPGTANGQLPPGALPLTSADGLGDEAAYARCVATQVKAQTGVVPPLSGACPAVPTTAKAAKTKHSKASTPTSSPSAAASSPALAAPPAAGAPSAAPIATASAAVPPAATAVTADPIKTVGAYSALGRFGLPAALIAGLLLLIAGLALRWGAESWAMAKVVGPRIGPWAAGAVARVRRRR